MTYFVKGGSNDGGDEIGWFHVARIAHFSVACSVVNHHGGRFHCVNCHNVLFESNFVAFSLLLLLVNSLFYSQTPLLVVVLFYYPKDIYLVF